MIIIFKKCETPHKPSQASPLIKQKSYVSPRLESVLISTTFP